MLFINSYREAAVAGLILGLSCMTGIASEDSRLDATAIGEAAGTGTTSTANGVVRIGWTRDEVPVTVDGLPFPPAAGLGSWAAFKGLPNGSVIVMGDTVVFEDEITPAMDAAFAHGLEVTALHNHFVFDRPPAYFMHIGGRADDAAELASGVRAMWDAIKQVRSAQEVPADRSSAKLPELTGNHDVPELESILDSKGNLNGKVLKFSFERKARMRNVEFGSPMGLSTWAAFSGNARHAIVDGDFAMTKNELQPVMHALRDAGIHIVALHNHMVGEAPAYYFLHFWGNGDPESLARGIRTALDAQQR